MEDGIFDKHYEEEVIKEQMNDFFQNTEIGVDLNPNQAYMFKQCFII